MKSPERFTSREKELVLWEAVAKCFKACGFALDCTDFHVKIAEAGLVVRSEKRSTYNNIRCEAIHVLSEIGTRRKILFIPLEEVMKNFPILETYIDTSLLQEA